MVVSMMVSMMGSSGLSGLSGSHTHQLLGSRQHACTKSPCPIREPNIRCGAQVRGLMCNGFIIATRHLSGADNWRTRCGCCR